MMRHLFRIQAHADRTGLAGIEVGSGNGLQDRDQFDALPCHRQRLRHLGCISRCNAFSAEAMSASASSVSMTAMSDSGSILARRRG